MTGRTRLLLRRALRASLGLQQGVGFHAGCTPGRLWREAALAFLGLPGAPVPRLPLPLEAEYRLLDALPGGTVDELRRCWRATVRRCHPDRFPAGSAEQREATVRFREACRAYRLLCQNLERRN
jgi:hypothetical protein